MKNEELQAILIKQFSALKEIPAPVAAANAPAHEGHPYRDPLVHLSCPVAQWPDLAKFLKEDPRLDFDFLTMLTAVDYLKVDAPEIPHMDVVAHLYSMKLGHKLVVKISVPRDNAVVPSVIHLWKTADWQEREVYDMYGIQFSGHPNCTRILMWEGFPGWPMKKDFVHIPDRYDD